MTAEPSDLLARSARAKAALLRDRVGQKPTWFDVDGPSMWSAIPGGAEVLVVGAARPHVGEIWAFCNETGAIVVHRCRRARGSRYVFQGDRCRHRDAPVPVDHLVGRVSAVRVDGDERPIGTRERVVGWTVQTMRLLSVQARERARWLRTRTF